MVDDLLKDEFKIQSQHTASAFCSIFFMVNLVYCFAVYLFLSDACTHKDQFYDDVTSNQVVIWRAYSIQGHIGYFIVFSIVILYGIFYIYCPFLTVNFLSKYYENQP